MYRGSVCLRITGPTFAGTGHQVLQGVVRMAESVLIRLVVEAGVIDDVTAISSASVNPAVTASSARSWHRGSGEENDRVAGGWSYFCTADYFGCANARAFCRGTNLLRCCPSSARDRTPALRSGRLNADSLGHAYGDWWQ